MIKKMFLIFTIILSYEIFANNNSIFSVGGTYDSMSLHPTSAKSCLKVAGDEANLEILNPHASLDFNQNQSLESVQRALGVEYSSKMTFGAFEINTNYNYAQSSQNDDYTLNLNYIYQYNGKAVFKKNALVNGTDALTPTALAVLNSANEFRNMCGNKFIAQLDAGASLLMRITLKFNSQVEKNYYDEGFQHIGGLQNILEIIKSNTNHVHFNLSATGLQVGGNPQLLNDLFIKNGGTINKDGYAILECGADNDINSSCTNLVNQIISYAQILKQQLNKPTDLYLTNPTLSDWVEIGIDAKPAPVDSQIIQAMQQLTFQYEADYKDLKFIINYKNMLTSKDFLSLEFQRNLDNLLNKYQRVINLYTDPSFNAMNCFNGYVNNTCLITRDRIIATRNSILADSSLNQLLYYLKTNQYLVSLFITPDLSLSSQCMISPISERITHQYMVNCNGQVSGSFDSDKAISLYKSEETNSLIVNNFAYKYNKDGVDSNFVYLFNQGLQKDSFYDDMYAGSAIINTGVNITTEKYNVMFTNIY